MIVRRVLLTTDAVGGVWTYTVELAQALSQLGVEPVIATLGPSPDENQYRQLPNINVFDTGLPLDWLTESREDITDAGAAIAQLAKDVRADAVQLHTAALACDVQFGRPVIAVQHSCVATWWATVRGSALPQDFEWRRSMMERGLNSVGAAVAPSAAFAGQTEAAYNLHHPVAVVHNGRTASGLPDCRPEDSILTVGRLWDEGKNVRVLDGAAGLIDGPFEAIGPTHGPNGTGVTLDNMACSGSLPVAVIAERLASRPIFASSALYEPFGLSVLEAAQAGCALVLSDIPTFRELWDGVALFADARSPTAFAEAFRLLLADPARREELGQSARHRARRFTPERTAAQMLRIYETAAQSARAPVASAA